MGFFTNSIRRGAAAVFIIVWSLFQTVSASSDNSTVLGQLKPSMPPTMFESAQVLNSRYAWFGLIKTVDGGQTWARVHFDQLALDQLGVDEGEEVRTYFVSPSTGWLVSLSSTWKTTNGGLSWARESRDDLSAMAFADPKHGWMQFWKATRRAFEFARTNDGGRTWSVCPNKSNYSLPYSDSPYFISATHLTAVVIGDQASKPQFATSLDAGCSWTVRPIPESMFDHFATPYFLTTDQGWLPGAYLGSLISTKDGGVTWKSIVVTIHENSISIKPAEIVSVYFATESHGWILAFDRTKAFPIYVTFNSGKTWSRETSAGFLGDYGHTAARSPRAWDVFTRAAFLAKTE